LTGGPFTGEGQSDPMNVNSELKHLPAFIAKMEAEQLPRMVIDTFVHYYRQLVGGSTGLISDNELAPVDENELADATQLDEFAPMGRNVLSKTVMIVLNGGLGTSMGLTSAKSLLPVKDGKTFLAMIIDQASRAGVDLVFMNSFNTHADTMAAVETLRPRRRPYFFLQHKYPKILKDGFGLAHWPTNPDLEWNPPGHGEIYTALHTSGLLQQLMGDGIEYALIANADNLGATLDHALLGYFAHRQAPFMMEVAQRTPADMKGGHLARAKDGRLLLREIAQCPEPEHRTFQDIRYYRFFNTNSIWLNLKALADLIQTNPVLHLPIILNPKTIDPRDKTSPTVYQIETAMGSAISLFKDATAVKVPLQRFSPVKKTHDLLALRSDCFSFTPAGQLVPNPLRRLDRIQIQLDTDYFGRIDDFEKRFGRGAPSLIECESLIVEGDVYFESKVVVKGRVRICNTRKSPATIAAGTVIQGDLTF
jgi:UTP--glucose-1-phosphate uridylyltransferase